MCKTFARHVFVLGAIAATAGCATRGGGDVPIAFFQAHRGGLDEMPENTLAAFRRAWSIPGAVPEVDIRTTADGVLICLHDETLARTTDAPEPLRSTPVAELEYADIGRWNAAVNHPGYRETARVPRLTEFLDLMAAGSERQAYLDIKDAGLDALWALVRERGLEDRVIAVHGDPAFCAELRQRFGVRTMTWLSGEPDEIKQQYNALREKHFSGISQLQFHLRVARTKPRIEYVLDEAFLRRAAAETRSHGVELQLRPFRFDPESLGRLLDLGVRWYVADAPAAFAEALARAR